MLSSFWTIVRPGIVRQNYLRLAGVKDKVHTSNACRPQRSIQILASKHINELKWRITMRKGSRACPSLMKRASYRYMSTTGPAGDAEQEAAKKVEEGNENKEQEEERAPLTWEEMADEVMKEREIIKRQTRRRRRFISSEDSQTPPFAESELQKEIEGVEKEPLAVKEQERRKPFLGESKPPPGIPPPQEAPGTTPPEGPRTTPPEAPRTTPPLEAPETVPIESPPITPPDVPRTPSEAPPGFPMPPPTATHPPPPLPSPAIPIETQPIITETKIETESGTTTATTTTTTTATEAAPKTTAILPTVPPTIPPTIPPTTPPTTPPQEGILGAITPKRITLDEARQLGIDVSSQTEDLAEKVPEKKPQRLFVPTEAKEEEDMHEKLRRAAQWDGKPKIPELHLIDRVTTFGRNYMWWLAIAAGFIIPSILSDSLTPEPPQGFGFEERWDRYEYANLSYIELEKTIFEMCGMAALAALPPFNPVTMPLARIRGDIMPVFPESRQGSKSPPIFWKLRIDCPGPKESEYDSLEVVDPVQAASPTYHGAQFMWIISRTWEKGEPVIRILMGKQVGGTIKANPKRSLIPWRMPAFRPRRFNHIVLAALERDLMFNELYPSKKRWYEALQKLGKLEHYENNAIVWDDVSEFEIQVLVDSGYDDVILAPDSVEWPADGIILAAPFDDEEDDELLDLDDEDHEWEEDFPPPEEDEHLPDEEFIDDDINAAAYGRNEKHAEHPLRERGTYGEQTNVDEDYNEAYGDDYNDQDHAGAHPLNHGVSSYTSRHKKQHGAARQEQAHEMKEYRDEHEHDQHDYDDNEEDYVDDYSGEETQNLSSPNAGTLSPKHTTHIATNTTDVTVTKTPTLSVTKVAQRPRLSPASPPVVPTIVNSEPNIVDVSPEEWLDLQEGANSNQAHEKKKNEEEEEEEDGKTKDLPQEKPPQKKRALWKPQPTIIGRS